MNKQKVAFRVLLIIALVFAYQLSPHGFVSADTGVISSPADDTGNVPMTNTSTSRGDDPSGAAHNLGGWFYAVRQAGIPEGGSCEAIKDYISDDDLAKASSYKIKSRDLCDPNKFFNFVCAKAKARSNSFEDTAGSDADGTLQQYDLAIAKELAPEEYAKYLKAKKAYNSLEAFPEFKNEDERKKYFANEKKLREDFLETKAQAVLAAKKDYSRYVDRKNDLLARNDKVKMASQLLRNMKDKMVKQLQSQKKWARKALKNHLRKLKRKLRKNPDEYNQQAKNAYVKLDRIYDTMSRAVQAIPEEPKDIVRNSFEMCKGDQQGVLFNRKPETNTAPVSVNVTVCPLTLLKGNPAELAQGFSKAIGHSLDSCAMDHMRIPTGGENIPLPMGGIFEPVRACYANVIGPGGMGKFGGPIDPLDLGDPPKRPGYRERVHDLHKSSGFAFNPMAPHCPKPLTNSEIASGQYQKRDQSNDAMAHYWGNKAFAQWLQDWTHKGASKSKDSKRARWHAWDDAKTRVKGYMGYREENRQIFVDAYAPYCKTGYNKSGPVARPDKIIKHVILTDTLLRKRLRCSNSQAKRKDRVYGSKSKYSKNRSFQNCGDRAVDGLIDFITRSGDPKVLAFAKDHFNKVKDHRPRRPEHFYNPPVKVSKVDGKVVYQADKKDVGKGDRYDVAARDPGTEKKLAAKSGPDENGNTIYCGDDEYYDPEEKKCEMEFSEDFSSRDRMTALEKCRKQKRKTEDCKKLIKEADTLALKDKCTNPSSDIYEKDQCKKIRAEIVAQQEIDDCLNPKYKVYETTRCYAIREQETKKDFETYENDVKVAQKKYDDCVEKHGDKAKTLCSSEKAFLEEEKVALADKKKEYDKAKREHVARVKKDNDDATRIAAQKKKEEEAKKKKIAADKAKKDREEREKKQIALVRETRKTADILCSDDKTKTVEGAKACDDARKKVVAAACDPDNLTPAACGKAEAEGKHSKKLVAQRENEKKKEDKDKDRYLAGGKYKDDKELASYQAACEADLTHKFVKKDGNKWACYVLPNGEKRQVVVAKGGDDDGNVPQRRTSTAEPKKSKKKRKTKKVASSEDYKFREMVIENVLSNEKLVRQCANANIKVNGSFPPHSWYKEQASQHEQKKPYPVKGRFFPAIAPDAWKTSELVVPIGPPSNPNLYKFKIGCTASCDAKAFCSDNFLTYLGQVEPEVKPVNTEAAIETDINVAFTPGSGVAFVHKVCHSKKPEPSAVCTAGTKVWNPPGGVVNASFVGESSGTVIPFQCLISCDCSRKKCDASAKKIHYSNMKKKPQVAKKDAGNTVLKPNAKIASYTGSYQNFEGSRSVSVSTGGTVVADNNNSGGNKAPVRNTNKGGSGGSDSGSGTGNAGTYVDGNRVDKPSDPFRFSYKVGNRTYSKTGTTGDMTNYHTGRRIGKTYGQPIACAKYSPKKFGAKVKKHVKKRKKVYPSFSKKYSKKKNVNRLYGDALLQMNAICNQMIVKRFNDSFSGGGRYASTKGEDTLDDYYCHKGKLNNPDEQDIMEARRTFKKASLRIFEFKDPNLDFVMPFECKYYCNRNSSKHKKDKKPCGESKYSVPVGKHQVKQVREGRK